MGIRRGAKTAADKELSRDDFNLPETSPGLMWEIDKNAKYILTKINISFTNVKINRLQNTILTNVLHKNYCQN